MPGAYLESSDHKQMAPSLQSKIFHWILKVSDFNTRVEKRAKSGLKRSKSGFAPGRLRRSYQVSLRKYQTKEIATFESGEEASLTHIFFLHGGAYLFEASPRHWKLAEKIVKKSRCRMTLIDYPLAPEHNYMDTFRMITGAYEMLCQQYPADNFIFLGDSAGGGLALAFTQKLVKEKHHKLPVQLILLSPWLDLSLSNEALKELEESDHILTVDMLRHAAKSYSGGDDPGHYLLSPINGELEDLPPTIVFYGADELFAADCRKLRSMTKNIDQSIAFREYPGMQHDWVLFPLPESDRAVDEICAFIDKK